MNKKEIIYLACPYSHSEKYVMTARFMIANKIAAKLIAEGNYVLSPISHTHPIAEEGELPRGWQYWGEFDRKLLSVCTKMIVVKLPYWEWSSGVQAEIELAKELSIPVEYIEYESNPHVVETMALAKSMEESISNIQTNVFSYTWKGDTICSTNEYAGRCNLALGNYR